MRAFRISLMVIFLLTLINVTQAATIHVPKDYPTIQKGVDASSNGDIVIVADGTYKGVGNVNLDFKGKAITLESENGPAKCIIDCEKMNETRGFNFHSGETLLSVLDGFTIQNGNSVSGGGIACSNSSPKIINNIITSNSGSDGGGIYCAYSSPTIGNNTITGNSAVSAGGGIYCLEYSSPLIDNNIISKNKSGSGGGIGLWKHLTHPSITNNTIIENFATSDGGGINCSWEAIKIDGNIITKNVTNSSGGGISNATSSVTITNNIISENSANLYGGGISCDGANINNNIIRGNKANSGAGIVSFGGAPTLVNNTIVNNSAISKGGAILYSSGSLPMITNTILWNNKPQEAAQGDSGNITISYSDIQGGKTNISGAVSWLEGNIDADPLFTNAANNDYHLSKDSPCINAGTMTLIVPEKDIEDNPRPNPSDSEPDIGAYEYPSAVVDDLPVDITTGLVGYWPFDEVTDNVAKDLSNYQNNGTLRGTKLVDGKLGKALSFNGTSDYVEVPFSNSLNIAPDKGLTIATWVNMPNPHFGAVVVKGDYTWDWGIYISDNNTFMMGLHNQNEIFSSTKIAKNTWYHVAGVYDNSNWYLYVNGKLEAKKENGARIWMSIDGLSIGKKGTDNVFTNFFQGIIDEVRIWNRALNADEINQIMSDTNDRDNASMILIPAGDFVMGCDVDCGIFQFPCEDSKPAHTVYLDAFYMDTCEVTNAQYKKFVDATGYKKPKSWEDPRFSDSNQPVVCVNWYDAKAYADWANKRLPTEAEWEKAARGGLTGVTYPWKGDVNCNNDNFGGCSYQPTPVGTHIPNGYGLYEIGANVREWCADWYDPNYYKVSPKNNPKGPDSGSARVVRGASFANNGDHMLTHVRIHASDPSILNDVVGFRCAKNADIPVPTAKLGLGSAETSPGSQFKAQLNINDATGVSSGDITIKYDPGILSVGDIKTTPLTSNMNLIPNTSVSGQIKIAMAGTNPIQSGSGSLIDIYFTANSKAVAGTETSLQLVDAELYNEAGNVIPMNFENGIVKIKQACIKGDVNNDGNIRSNDATLILRMAAGLLEPNDYQKCAADYNGDGKIGSNDATLVLRKAAGLLAPTQEAIVDSRNITIRLDDVSGLSGNTVTLPIKVNASDIIASGDISINYDNAILRAVDVSSDPDILLVCNITKPGEIRIAFAASDNVKSNTIANIKFEILADKISNITFKQAELYRLDATQINPKMVNGRFQSLAIRPEHSDLLQNYPNPFNPETWIPYQLKNDSQVAIQIYSISGELVRKLELGYKPAGIHNNRDRAAYWDGKNESGEYVSSGIYFYTIQAGEFTSTRKMTLMK